MYKIKELASVFAIDVAAHAVMGNHYLSSGSASGTRADYRVE